MNSIPKIFKEIYKNLDEKIKEVGQDGGLVTTLLMYLFDKNKKITSQREIETRRNNRENRKRD